MDKKLQAANTLTGKLICSDCCSHNSRELLEMMANTMEGGLKGSYDDETYSFFYVNEGLPKMLGYTYEEFIKASGGSAAGAVYPPDLPQALKDCDACFAKGLEYQVQYRMQKKDGTLIWVMDSGKKFQSEDGKMQINSMITDITPLKTALSALELEKERYQVALGNISDKLFEYDASQDVCYIYAKDSNDKVSEERYDNFIVRLRESHYFDEENYEKLKDAYYNKQKAHVQLCVTKNSTNLWLFIQFRTLYDASGQLYRSIGTLRNITDEVNANQELIEKAQLDALTSVYNQETFNTKVNEFLSDSKTDTGGALLLLDLDDFKTINDRLGHLFGNAVLISVANCLKKHCAPSDFVGRVGGDEFAVFLCSSGRERAGKVAEKIVADMSRIFSRQDERLAVSCSMGIHIAQPGAGQSFESLFIAADKALYRIKNHGKNSWCFYEDLAEEETQEFQTYTDTKQVSIDQDLNKELPIKERLSAICLEILNRADSFDIAVHLLMEVIGNQYNLSRIAIIPSQTHHTKSSISYQWTDQWTPTAQASDLHLTQKDTARFFSSFDRNGICVINENECQGYSPAAKKFLLADDAKTVLYIAMYINTKHSGMITFSDYRKKRKWSDAEKQELNEVSKIIASHMDRDTILKNACMEMEYYKSFDPLTGLSSMAKFKEECQTLMESTNEDFAIIYSDIKDFKYVNETIGYTQGDSILRAFAKMLSAWNTPESRIARATGDQFVVFVPCKKTRKSVLDKIQQLNHDFCAQQNHAHTNLNFRIRSGVYFIDSDCLEITVAIDRANTARQSILHLQKSKTIVYNETIGQQVSLEKKIINRMDYALDHGEFQVYLQPLVDLQNLKIAGAEALIRWHTPDGKILCPDQFIPIFEETGFITRLDAYVLSTICVALRQLEKTSKKLVPISANISCLNAQNEEMLAQIQKVASFNNVNPRQLTFELTETAFLKDMENVVSMMEMLQQNGFKTAVDDFGAGYSLLNMIADIPADTIKIDRNFLLSCEQTTRGIEFLKQLISMIRNMGYATFCEGIETKHQLDLLTELGCDFGQGYIFSRPVPMTQFFEKLQISEFFSSLRE